MNIISLNGQFIEKEKATISPFDHGFLYGDAVYETLLIERGSICFFIDHWDRLQNSLQKLGIPLPNYCNTKEKLQTLCRDLIQKNNTKRARLRITISRGENHFDFSSASNPTVLIALSPLPAFAEELYTKGISISTIEEKRAAPTLKSTNFIPSILGRRKLLGTDNFEAIFVTPEGYFREGTVSNIFGVQGKNIFIAPRKSVLGGTLQTFVEKIFIKNRYTIMEKNFTAKNIFEDFDELYISNSLIGVLPVQQINNTNFKTTFPVFEQFFGSDFFEKLTNN